MTWTSDNRAQRACLKGQRASGPKWLEPICYSILGYISANINGGLKHLAKFYDVWCLSCPMISRSSRNVWLLKLGCGLPPSWLTQFDHLCFLLDSKSKIIALKCVISRMFLKFRNKCCLSFLYTFYIFKIMCIAKELEYCWTCPSLLNCVKW